MARSEAQLFITAKNNASRTIRALRKDLSDLIGDQSNFVRAFQQGQTQIKSFADTLSAVSNQVSTLEGLNKLDLVDPASIQQAGSSLQSLRNSIQELTRVNALVDLFRGGKVAVEDARLAWLRATEQVRELAHGIAGTDAPTKAQIARFEAAKREAARLKKEYRKLRDQLNKTRNDLASVGISTQNLAENERKLASAVQRSVKAVANADKTLQRYGKTEERVAKDSGRLVKTLAASAAGIFAAGRVREFVTGVEDTARQIAATRANLRLALGSDDQAGEEIDFIRGEADRLGLSFQALATEYGTFLRVGQDSRLELDELRQVFSAVAERVSFSQKGIVDLQRALVQLVQILSLGRATTLDFVKQFGQNLPGAINDTAAAMGLTGSELRQLISTTKVSERILLDFAKGSREALGPELQNAIKGSGQSLTRLENTIGRLKAEFSQSGFSDALAKAFDRLNTALSSTEGEKFARSLGRAVAGLVEVIALLIENWEFFATILGGTLGVKLITKVVGAIKAAKKATTLFSGALLLLSGHAGLVAAAIATLGGAYLLYTKRQKKATDETRKFHDVLGNIGLIQGAQATKKAINVGAEFAAELQKRLKTARTELAKLQSDVAEGPQPNIAPASVIAKQAEIAGLESQIRSIEVASKSASKRVDALLSKDGPAVASGFQPSDDGGGDREAANAANAANAARARIQEEENLAKEIEGIRIRLLQAQGEDVEAAFAEIDRSYAELLGRLSGRTDDIDLVNKLIDIEKATAQFSALSTEIERLSQQQALEILDTDDAESQIDSRLDQLRALSEQIGTAQAITEFAGIEADVVNARVEGVQSEIDAALARFDAGRADFDATISAVQTRVDDLRDLAARSQSATVQNQANEAQINAAEALIQTSFGQLDDVERRLRLGELSRRAAREEALQLVRQIQALASQVGDDRAALSLRETIRDFESLRTLADDVRESFAGIFETSFAATLRETINASGELARKQEQLSNIEKNHTGTTEELRAKTAELKNEIKELEQQSTSALGVLDKFFKKILDAVANAAINEFARALTTGIFGAFHSGGVVGSAAPQSRRVSPLVFAGARRFAHGGIAGLAPDEVPIIAHRNEEIVRRDDPRHRDNLTATQSGQPHRVVHNVQMDESILRRTMGEVIESYLSDVWATR